MTIQAKLERQMQVVPKHSSKDQIGSDYCALFQSAELVNLTLLVQSPPPLSYF